MKLAVLYFNCSRQEREGNVANVGKILGTWEEEEGMKYRWKHVLNVSECYTGIYHGNKRFMFPVTRPLPQINHALPVLASLHDLMMLFMQFF